MAAEKGVVLEDTSSGGGTVFYWTIFLGGALTVVVLLGSIFYVVVQRIDILFLLEAATVRVGQRALKRFEGRSVASLAA